MTDPPKKPPRFTNINQLVKANQASNDRNHRPYTQPSSSSSYEKKESNMNNYQKEKVYQKENEKSAPKPLLDCLQPGPLLISKPYEKSSSHRRRKNKPFNDDHFERSNDDDVNKPDISPGKIEIGRSTIDIREPTEEHLFALKNAFDKILSERFLSNDSLKKRQFVFTKLRQIITDTRPGSQVNLYGSIYFECCLEKPGIMDIDVQFQETFQHDSLKELFDIIKKSDFYKEARIDTEHKPSCINLIINEPNMHIKLTTGYNRGINLSKLIRIYTRFDTRLIKLLRLFRILAKVCDIDKPDIGTLHPIVFHIMVIHFLQQVEPPVLPCLHEYAYGIDHVPITLNENQYEEFFNICKNYSLKWKSENQTNVEMLFLQLLSYYVKTFNSKQFVVSIQTRMPVMKIDKNWYNRKLLVEDPTDIKRGLCQTMQSIRSIDYFRHILNTSLNYFGRKQKKLPKILSNKSTIENPDDDDLIVINDDNDELNQIPIIEGKYLLHNSYKLFYKRLPPTVARDVNIKQARVREYFRQTFDNKKNFLPIGIIQLNSLTNQFENSDENDIQEALQHDLETNFDIIDENDDDDLNENHIDLLERLPSNEDEDDDEGEENEQSTIPEFLLLNDEEQQTIETNSSIIINDTESENSMNEDLGKTLSKDETPLNNIESDKTETNSPKPSPTSPIDIKVNGIVTDNNNDDIPSPFTSTIKFEQINDNEQKLPDNPSEFFYDFQPKNFHAEEGAPVVCTTCNRIGHTKTECPELNLPDMIDLPTISDKWIEILSLLCRQITERSKPSQNDIDNRKKILNQLEKQFRKDYPDCSLHAFGSFYNGFGFQHSDLDVCLVFKDEREQNNDEVIQIMQKILRSMKYSNTFENVQPVLRAKVPIIRSRYRQLNIEIDISLHNMLAIENTKLLKTYTEIDSRVAELGYMIKHLAKFCGIGDASRGTLSSYAYIIMLIHFLQQIQPAVLPVLQQLSDDSTKKNSMFKKCSKWNVYFYQNLSKINELWKKENHLSTGALWIEFLRFYTEEFNYEEHVITIRQKEPLLKDEKGWFRRTVAIEDPFELSHNLAGGLSSQNWIIIRRVFIRARQQFCMEHKELDTSQESIINLEDVLFNIDELCPTNAPKRCEWCHGPYHIRKRCPKLATLVYENDKKYRVNKNSDQQTEERNFSSKYSNKYYSNNKRNYPQSAPPNQQPFRYDNQDRSKEYHHSYQQNNSGRRCFYCGSFDHIKVQCPKYKKK